MCTKAPTTVDYESVNRSNYLSELDACLKKFNGALTTTMNSYRNLLTALDQMSQVFGNLAGGAKPEVKDPVIAMRNGMRDLKDKGPFVAFNSDLHDGTMNVLEPLRADLKKAQKSLTDLNAKQKDYDGLRAVIERTEKQYAKKDKPLTQSESYKKQIAKRDKSKHSYETSRDGFEVEVTNLRDHVERVLTKSMNNYLHCTATFSGYLETFMNEYRTDIGNDGQGASHIRMDKLKEEFERRSTVSRQTMLNTNNSSTPSTQPNAYPDDETPMAALHIQEDNLKGPGNQDDNTIHASVNSSDSPRYPLEEKHTEEEGGEGLYPTEDAKNPLVVE